MHDLSNVRIIDSLHIQLTLFVSDARIPPPSSSSRCPGAELMVEPYIWRTVTDMKNAKAQGAD